LVIKDFKGKLILFSVLHYSSASLGDGVETNYSSYDCIFFQMASLAGKWWDALLEYR